MSGKSMQLSGDASSTKIFGTSAVTYFTCSHVKVLPTVYHYPTIRRCRLKCEYCLFWMINKSRRFLSWKNFQVVCASFRLDLVAFRSLPFSCPSFCGGFQLIGLKQTTTHARRRYIFKFIVLVLGLRQSPICARHEYLTMSLNSTLFIGIFLLQVTSAKWKEVEMLKGYVYFLDKYCER